MGIKERVEDGLASLSTRARSHRFRIGVGGAIGLVLVALVVAVLVSAFSPRGGSEVVAANTPDPLQLASESPTVYVHVLGAVATPGLYQLPPGDRVFDAVAAAGGFTPDADKAAVNLARQLSDGEQLTLPRIGEGVPGAVAAAGTTGSPTPVMNLNTATVTDLDSLPRIGPATAQKIVDWRTAHGRFTSVDDLLSVAGIGQKTVDGLRDLVTV